MATISSGRLGIARTYALVFGIAYLAVAILEVMPGSGGLRQSSVCRLTWRRWAGWP